MWPEAGTPDIPAGSDAQTVAKLRAVKTNRFEWGVKGTYAWARLPYYGTRLILDVETMSPADDDEAAAIGRITDGLLKRLPGIQTIVMDGIYRHVHIEPYMRKGLLVVNKPAQGAKNGRNSIKVGDRWEKSHHIETVEVPFGAGVCRHRIYGIGGTPYEQRINAAGEATYVALDDSRATCSRIHRLVQGDQHPLLPLRRQEGAQPVPHIKGERRVQAQ